MTKEELLAKLQAVTAPNAKVGVEMYFLIDHEQKHLIRAVDIDDDAGKEICKALQDEIKVKFLTNTSLRVAPLSAADDRKNTVYKYDHGDMPWDLDALRTIKASREQDELSFKKHPIASVVAMVFVLGGNGQEVVIYKKRHSISVIKQDSTFLGYFKDDKRFVQFDQDLLKVNDKFEFILVEDDIYVCSVKTLEQFFGFHDIVYKEAATKLTLIASAGLILDLAPLEKLIKGRLPAAKKLVKAKAATIVLKKSAQSIFDFAQKNHKLKNKFKLSDDGKRLRLDTIVAQELFLKLLDDDYLRSELTGLEYESDNKDQIVEEEPAVSKGTTPEVQPAP